jgi:TetR/AcrR family acrAB operon transcriptional repressor
MVRKTKDDAQLTCAALLDAAERVFFENGVANTTLNDIAKAAGLTRGAIYWHFKDKGDLLQAMFARAMLPMEAMLQELEQASAANPLQALRTMCVQALINLARSADQQRVFSIMFHKCEHVGPIAEILDDKHAKKDECLQQVRTVMQKAVDSGHLPADTDVALAHQVMNSFMAGTMSEWLFAPQAFSLEDAAPAMVDMLLAGLQACPPRRALPGKAAAKKPAKKSAQA